MPFCKDCDEHYLTTHTCPPLWEARIYDKKYPNDWTEVHGIDPARAAARFAECYDRNGDYDIIKRGGDEIEVRKPGEDKIILVTISTETVPHYYGHIQAAR